MLEFLFATLAAISGLIAAWQWFRSSRSKFEYIWTVPDGNGHGEPAERGPTQMDINVSTITFIHNIGRLNKWAAIWTGVSIFLSAITTLVSHWL
jgi:hypothetical protein